MKKVEYKGIAINPFDKWVYGSLLTIYDSVTEKTNHYIQTDGSRVRVFPDSICRMVYQCDGVMYFDKDIIEYVHEGLRRIEPIIDDSLVVYIGRQQNEYAFKILGYHELNIKILGNVIEHPELLTKQWGKIGES